MTATGIYAIAAYGASGGAGYDFLGNTFAGGLGAGIGGDFILTAGEVIDFYVAQQGSNGAGHGDKGGGGGGTFIVVDGTNLPLIVAAGGGGAGINGCCGFLPTDGGLTTSGGTGQGGSNGNGGGGGGFLSDGQDSNVTGTGGKGFPTLTGGVAFNGHGAGGYGGGGSIGGGGGGYTGGNGSCCGSAGGQGGSSYLEPGIFATILTTNSGNGSASITFVASIPEPATWLLLVTAAAAGFTARKRRT